MNASSVVCACKSVCVKERERVFEGKKTSFPRIAIVVVSIYCSSACTTPPALKEREWVIARVCVNVCPLTDTRMRRGKYLLLKD